MAGLCGWFHHSGSAPTPDLKAMARELPDHALRHAALERDHYGLNVLSCDDNSGVIERHGRVLALEGTPYWLPDAPRRATTEHGFLASVVDSLIDDADGALAALGGGFSLVMHNLATGESLLAVDRMGQRPLCFAQGEGDDLYASSHATALRGLPAVDEAVDYQGIYNYVYFNVVPSPGTIFRGIRKLKPGYAVRVANGKASEARFWHPRFGRYPRRPDGRLLDVVRAAVGRCDGSASVGCFLSGGLDSSTVAGVLNEQTDGPAKAFTIGFAQDGYDEIEYARTATRHFNLALHDYYITGADVADAFGEVARAYDEPFGNSSAAPTLICARLAARNGITTLLAGDGGDELFAGNERYATQKLFGYYQHVPALLRRALLEPFFGRASVIRRGRGLQHKVRRYIEQANVPMPMRTQTYNLLHTTSPTEVFDADFLRHVDTHAPLEQLAEVYQENSDADELDRMLQCDWKYTLADNDLRKVGRMCDLAGVTVRYPLLDDAVIEHSIDVPSAAKLRRMELRSYYKKQTRGFLPEEIINKSKHGFGLPFGEWLRKDDDLRALVSDRVAGLKQRGVFSPAWIDRLLEQQASDHAAFYGNFVWVLAMFEEWCQQHGVSW